MLNGAKYMAESFTSVNFGWNIYLAPDSTSNGMQPDMYEYVCSRGAAWNSPISLMVTSLNELKKHPRTEDNLEVIKTWEDARISGYFTEEQKNSLKDPFQEHILLKNEKGLFEMHPYKKVAVSGNSNDIMAYIFRRNNQTWIVYWHTKGKALIKLPVQASAVEWFDKPEKKIKRPNNLTKNSVFQADKRRFWAFNLPEKEVIDILSKCEIIAEQ